MAGIHNPLVVASSPTGPTKGKRLTASNRGPFFFCGWLGIGLGSPVAASLPIKPLTLPATSNLAREQFPVQSTDDRQNGHSNWGSTAHR